MKVESVTIKHNGVFYEISVDQLDVNPYDPTDVEILAATKDKLEATSLEGFVISLEGYVIDPPEEERLSGLHDAKSVLNIRPIT